jgi:hypothetical protein
LLLATVTTLILGAALVHFATGHRRLRSLKDVVSVGTAPSLSIIAEARNEARQIERALTSVLHLSRLRSSSRIRVLPDEKTSGTLTGLRS